MSDSPHAAGGVVQSPSQAAAAFAPDSRTFSSGPVGHESFRRANQQQDGFAATVPPHLTRSIPGPSPVTSSPVSPMPGRAQSFAAAAKQQSPGLRAQLQPSRSPSPKPPSSPERSKADFAKYIKNAKSSSPGLRAFRSPDAPDERKKRSRAAMIRADPSPRDDAASSKSHDAVILSSSAKDDARQRPG